MTFFIISLVLREPSKSMSCSTCWISLLNSLVFLALTLVTFRCFIGFDRDIVTQTKMFLKVCVNVPNGTVSAT